MAIAPLAMSARKQTVLELPLQECTYMAMAVPASSARKRDAAEVSTGVDI